MPPPYTYRAFGVAFRSAMPIPEMRAAAGDTADAVTIAIGPAPPPTGIPLLAPGVAAGPADFWMDVPGIARLLVRNGAMITMDAASPAMLDEARAYLLGSAMGALLHQRNVLPLHASAVLVDGRAIAFAGTSGAGKSTLALAMVQRGHRLICDDICAVTLAGDAPAVWPGLANLKLWQDALAAAGEAHEALAPVLATINKFKLPVAALADDRAMELDRAFLLSFADTQPVAIKPLAGAAGAAALVANTFRGQLVAPMGRAAAHFAQCLSVAQATRLAILERPRAIAAMEDVCRMIERAAAND